MFSDATKKRSGESESTDCRKHRDVRQLNKSLINPAVEWEQSCLFSQIARAKVTAKLCKLEKRTRKDWIGEWGLFLSSAPGVSRGFAGHRALQKLAEERDCS